MRIRYAVVPQYQEQPPSESRRSMLADRRVIRQDFRRGRWMDFVSAVLRIPVRQR